MITIHKEIKCDNCGNCDYYLGTNKVAEECFENHGGLVINKKHFCDGECYKEFCNTLNVKEVAE